MGFQAIEVLFSFRGRKRFYPAFTPPARFKEDTMNQTELELAKLAIGDRLREARIARGITQAELGELAGTNQAVITKIEQGKSCYNRMLDVLAIALEVNPAWLQWGEP